MKEIKKIMSNNNVVNNCLTAIMAAKAAIMFKKITSSN